MDNSTVARRLGSQLWGRVQHQKKLAEGIWQIDTPSHGGIVVDISIRTEVLDVRPVTEVMVRKDSGLINESEQHFIALEEDEEADIAEWLYADEIITPKFYQNFITEIPFEEWKENRLIMVQESLKRWNPEVLELFPAAGMGRNPKKASKIESINPTGFISEGDKFTVSLYDGRIGILEVVLDESCPSPCEDEENCGPVSLICWHDRYTLGSKHNFESPRDFLEKMVKKVAAEDVMKAANLTAKPYQGQEALDEAIDDMTNSQLYKLIQQSDNAVIAPLYLLEHSGISISMCSFADRWDSGQCGFAVVTKEDFDKAYGVNQNSDSFKNWRERAFEEMKELVSTYDDYLAGDCYGFIVKDTKNNEVDSAWGYIGGTYETSAVLDEYKIITELHRNF